MGKRGTYALGRAAQLSIIGASLTAAACSVIPLATDDPLPMPEPSTTTTTTEAPTTTTVPTTTTTTAPTTTEALQSTTAELAAAVPETTTTTIAPPQHNLPEGITGTAEEFLFERSTDLRIILLDDVSTCGSDCGEIELGNDGTRTRMSYQTGENTVLPTATDADLFNLLESLEGTDLVDLVDDNFAPGDWLENGPRLVIANAVNSVIVPTLATHDQPNGALDPLRDILDVLDPQWSSDGQAITSVVTRTIPGGRAIDVDYWTTPLSVGRQRCGTASINANWLTEDFSATYGLAVMDGQTIAGTFDDNDRGIFGERRGSGADLDEFWWNFTGRQNLKVLSNMAWRDGARLQLHSNFWSTELWGDQNTGWDWAVGGITLMTDGNLSAEMGHARTFNTRKHPFVAFKPPSTVTFGATIDMNALQLVQYLQGDGYTDVMKFDGGGSVEMNEDGVATVGGTDRPITVWLGLGC